MTTKQGASFSPAADLGMFWCYMALGALHELAHVLIALLFHRVSVSDISWVHVLLFRQTILPTGEKELWIRHAGWIFSLSVALILHCGQTKTWQWPAYLVALEAISTDLLGLYNFLLPILSAPDTSLGMMRFACGNFGIIFLHPAWYDNASGRKTGLDMLEKMISVTMMRGAQTGGAVTFVKRSRAHQDQLVGIRSRVVNQKRTDLSKGVRAKIESDLRQVKVSSLVGGPTSTHDFPLTFFGHTRFATSSISNFDGTHPHQWSPPRLQKVYRMGLNNVRKPESVLVENFITHNGDLDFYSINDISYGLDTIQLWLEAVTGYPMPSSVDSVAIAGLVDILHCQGCFGLAARYAVSFGLGTSNMSNDVVRPNLFDFGKLAPFFEAALDELMTESGHSLDTISSISEERNFLTDIVLSMLEVEQKRPNNGVTEVLNDFLKDEEEEPKSSLRAFCQVTVDAFFDNDLLWVTRSFLSNAKGSFGVGITSSLTAHRQLCLASRGQTLSVAFYPKKGCILYGSEQAAVKAGLNYETPGGDLQCEKINQGDRALRLDLDDLAGEVVLLDWGEGNPAVSPPNRHWPVYQLMNKAVRLIAIKDEAKFASQTKLHKRMTLLEGHEFVTPLPDECNDMVRRDIEDIPRICQQIQDDWKGYTIGATSLNRLTAWNLTKCLQQRMQNITNGSIERFPGSVDILLTGCEVSLWVAEQFASDLSKAFPRLGIKAVSSNKLLGLFGQDLSVPACGYPMSQETHDLKQAIVIIISHSGGTFAPLACSNLMKSFSQNLFVVTSEWDTQVAKQLRGMHSDNDHMMNSRIFSTAVGLRTAEPSSVSVAATHQLLTNIFEHICLVILGNPTFRYVSGAVVTVQDLQELERCNQDAIGALEEIVGMDAMGNKLKDCLIEKDLRNAGDVWAEHVLEGAKAYIMLFFYLFATVTTGFPAIRAIAFLGGVDLESDIRFVVGFLDACVYFWFPQISILFLRYLQGRPLRHRMVARTVVIADCPWVSQSIDSFLSKLFACSYSIAGLNVISGNPADHLVHRHTHRVVRGSLILCGRPDGRLSSLTSLETSTCLAVNQACSIQSIGGTAELVTVGHNPFKLPLSARAIYLPRHRPIYLCERLLAEIENDGAKQSKAYDRLEIDGSRAFDGPQLKGRSASALQGAYLDLQKEASRGGQQQNTRVEMEDHEETLEDVLEELMQEKARNSYLRAQFEKFDLDGDGTISLEEFKQSYAMIDSTLDEEQIIRLFHSAAKEKGYMTDDDFARVAARPEMNRIWTIDSVSRPRNLRQVHASRERYFGEMVRARAPPNTSIFALESTQRFSMELYEARIASLERLVAMTVMSHQLGYRVQQFFPKISCGLLGYRMDRSHSITRIQTTASPISGSQVRERVKHLHLRQKIKRAIEKISFAWCHFQEQEIQRLKKQESERKLNLSAHDEEFQTRTSRRRLSMEEKNDP